MQRKWSLLNVGVKTFCQSRAGGSAGSVDTEQTVPGSAAFKLHCCDFLRCLVRKGHLNKSTFSHPLMWSLLDSVQGRRPACDWPLRSTFPGLTFLKVTVNSGFYFFVFSPFPRICLYKNQIPGWVHTSTALTLGSAAQYLCQIVL